MLRKNIINNLHTPHPHQKTVWVRVAVSWLILPRNTRISSEVTPEAQDSRVFTLFLILPTGHAVGVTAATPPSRTEVT